MSESSYSSLPDDCLAGEKQKIRVKGKRDVLRICSLHFDDVSKMLDKFNAQLKQKEG